MLTYMDMHLRYTLPLVGILLLIARPFVNRLEIFKIVFICTMAFMYTTPWDTYMTYSEAWTYPPGRVLALVGYVPVEEFMFFVIQTTLTTLWTLLCVRWSTPCAHFNRDPGSYRLIRWAPICALAVAAAAGVAITAPGRPTFYLGCILWWVCPVVMFLWYGAGNYFVRNMVPSAFAVLPPTLFLCWVDQIALRDGVWHINESTSLQILAAEHLPVEEAFFFLVSNTLVVLGVYAFDKSCGMMDTYASEFPLRFALSWPSVCQSFRAFATPECAMPSVVAEDIARSSRALDSDPKSLAAAINLFPAGIRLDLIILHAFCRVTNDAIDNEQGDQKKKHKLDIVKSFIGELFADRKSDDEVLKNPQRVTIDWTKYKSELTDVEMSCFRAVSRIAFYLPRKPFDELLAGYQWDVEGRPVLSEDDLLSYANNTAGSIGALSAIVIIRKCDNYKYDRVENYDRVVELARQMGRVLKLVDIARNIVTDSESFGRCYVPGAYMDDEEEELRILCAEMNPRSLGDKKLKKYALRIVLLANKNQLLDLVDSVKCWPHETRGSVLAVLGVYRRIISVIQSSATYPTRVSISKFRKTLIGLYCLYNKFYNIM